MLEPYLRPFFTHSTAKAYVLQRVLAVPRYAVSGCYAVSAVSRYAVSGLFSQILAATFFFPLNYFIKGNVLHTQCKICLSYSTNIQLISLQLLVFFNRIKPTVGRRQ